MELTDILGFSLCAALAYVCLRVSRAIYGDYFAPAGLFLGINLASLALYHLDLLPLIRMDLQAYVLVSVAFFSFLLGSFLASPSLLRHEPLPARKLLCQSDACKGLVPFYYLTVSLSLAAWIFYITRIVPSGWTRDLWLLHGTGQSEYIMPYKTGYLVLLGALVPPTFVLSALVKRRISFLSTCLVLGQILALALLGIKSYLVIGLSTSLLVFAVAYPGRVKLKHFLILVCVLIIFMVVYNQTIRVFAPRRFPGSRFPAALSFLESPYLYITGPWAALTRVMASPPEQGHWGQATLEVVWKILGPSGIGIVPEQVPQYLPFVDIGPSGFNVYSLIGELYWEHGWFGTILGCLILGFISTKLYIMGRKRNNWVLYLLSAIFSYGILISFFAYYYRAPLTFLLLYTLFVGGLFERLSVRRAPLKTHQLIKL